MAYYLAMRDESGSTHRTEMGGNEVDGPPTDAAVESECDDWVSDGAWGDEGASVVVWWTLTDEDGDEVDTGRSVVEVEPDHDALIRAAGGDTSCEHEWTGEGEGGCAENPGVWSTGGTALSISTHCELCGLRRRERITGSQRNPGEHDTVSYSLPDVAESA